MAECSASIESDVQMSPPPNRGLPPFEKAAWAFGTGLDETSLAQVKTESAVGSRSPQRAFENRSNHQVVERSRTFPGQRTLLARRIKVLEQRLLILRIGAAARQPERGLSGDKAASKRSRL